MIAGLNQLEPQTFRYIITIVIIILVFVLLIRFIPELFDYLKYKLYSSATFELIKKISEKRLNGQLNLSVQSPNTSPQESERSEKLSKTTSLSDSCLQQIENLLSDFESTDSDNPISNE